MEKNKLKMKYLSNVYKFLLFNENNTNFNFKIITKDVMEKIAIPPKNKIRKIEIEDLKALNNIENISKEEEERLRELGLIRYRGGKSSINTFRNKIIKIN